MFAVTRAELWDAAYLRTVGKRKRPPATVDPRHLLTEVDTVAEVWRNRWLFERADAIKATTPAQLLDDQFQQIVNLVATVDPDCAVTLVDDLDDTDLDEVVERAAYGAAVLEWYQAVNKGEATVLFDFTLEEATRYLACRATLQGAGEAAAQKRTDSATAPKIGRLVGSGKKRKIKPPKPIQYALFA